ncbi:MAG TPA: CDP-alcohol phosphatidyltransferase family protein [Kofleriaceae bacterium]|nr:CDP-alcohol phosphatidyltransferase family protein [Kofleriaceae bacterium]
MTERWTTWANAVTLFRLVACVAIFGYARACADETANLVGLVAYWILDVADGALARWLDQETRIGAQLDILVDRVLVAFFYFNYATFYPQLLVPVCLFLVQFMFIDHFLSNQFMRWRLKSPNYFYEIDREIWRWNWSPFAKAVNTAAVTGVLVVSKSATAGTIVCGAMLVLKTWSTYRVTRLPAPEEGWPATPPASRP